MSVEVLSRIQFALTVSFHFLFPPRQKPGSFSLDRVLEKLLEASNQNK